MELTYNEIVNIHNYGLPQLNKLDTEGKALLSIFLLELQEEVSKNFRNYSKVHLELLNKFVIKEIVDDKERFKLDMVDENRGKYCFDTVENEEEFIKQVSELNQAIVKLNISKLPISALEGVKGVNKGILETIFKLVDRTK